MQHATQSLSEFRVVAISQYLCSGRIEFCNGRRLTFGVGKVHHRRVMPVFVLR